MSKAVRKMTLKIDDVKCQYTKDLFSQFKSIKLRPYIHNNSPTGLPEGYNPWTPEKLGELNSTIAKMTEILKEQENITENIDNAKEPN